MSFLESRQLLISTLSPVHIGCGEDYDPTRYVIEGDTLYEFEPCAAMAVLTHQDRDQLLKIVSGSTNDRMLQEVQAFFYHRRQALIPIANRRVPVGPKMVAFYQKRVGKTVQVESDGSQLLNRLEIERTFFNPAGGVPVLPGGSLKGAMRTALLDSINNGQPLLSNQERNLELQQRLFRYNRFEQDPMRLVHVADTVFMDEAEVGTELRFAVNRRRKAPKPGENSAQSQAEQRGLYQLLECVPAARFRVFAGQLTVQQVDQIKDNRNRLPALPLRWNTQQIAAACNRFYRPQLEMELNQMQERGYIDKNWAAILNRLLNGPVGERLNWNQAFLLRVGRHSGAESVTLNTVRSIKILLGRDSTTRQMRSENRPTGTSWWLAANDTLAKTGMLPFGWLLVELQSVDQGAGTWPEVQKQLSQLSTEYVIWLDRKHQQAEIDKRRQAEAKAKQEIEAAKAALSPEQKEITQLRDWFQLDRKTKHLKPIGRVVGTLNRLLKEGLSWPPDERQELAVLAEEIFSQKSISGDDKLQRERQTKIQQLREGKKP